MLLVAPMLIGGQVVASDKTSERISDRNTGVKTVSKQGVKAPAFVTLDAIPVCFDFGCKNNAVVDLPVTEWEGVAGWFHPAADTPEAEREQIKRAIGWMEVLIGRYTPTHRDLAFDLPPATDDTSHLFPGQQDQAQHRQHHQDDGDLDQGETGRVAPAALAVGRDGVWGVHRVSGID